MTCATYRSSEMSRDALQLRLGMQVIATAKKWKLRVADLFREAGHTGSPTTVLYHLVNEPKGLTLSELSKRMKLSGATLTKLVQRLERDEMISRRRMLGDGRSWLITMGPNGRAALDEFEVYAQAMRDRLFEGVSDADMATTLKVLDVVASRLSRAP